jgi:hypothetical protein
MLILYMYPNRSRNGYGYGYSLFALNEFTSHKSGATVLTPLTLVPSCAKIIEQTLWTLNNMNKNHRRTRENARVLRHESTLEDNPSQRVWGEEGALGERMSTLKYMPGINVIAVSNTQKKLR